MKSLVVALLCAGAACAQSISVGAIGGVPFTDAVDEVQHSTYSTVYKSTNFVVGPSLQVNLPASLRFEVDALYRPVKFQLNLLNVANSISSSQWQFPFLIQYRFGTPLVKPFLEAGLSFDHLSGISSAARAITSGPGQVLHTSNASVVLGGGVDVKIPFVRLSGELRFSRATVSEFQSISNLNTAEVLFGVHF
jgi:Outer membrane protein beta-barrel domain